MYINVDGLEIMVRLRRDELMQEAADEAALKNRSGYSLARRTLIGVGGLLVSTGMALEKMGVGQEVYRLTTTTSRSAGF